MALSCVLFFMGTRLYVCVRPEGSPFTSFAQVFVAAARKRRLLAPASPPDELFDPPYWSKLVAKIKHTDPFWWLDKAAVVTPEDVVVVGPAGARCSRWRSHGHITTCGGGQGSRSKVAAWVNMVALTAWLPAYDLLVVPALWRVIGREEGISQLQRIWIGLELSVVTMAVAVAVEHRRRWAGARLSWAWMVPQQAMAGLSEAFAAIGLNEPCNKESSESMRSVAGVLVHAAATPWRPLPTTRRPARWAGRPAMTGEERGEQQVAANDRLRPPRRSPPFSLSVRARRQGTLAGREREGGAGRSSSVVRG
uniref:Peptide transporter-like protein n=1 Tax=Oryza sativa subsp. japonica TaxID=39947 RepID=Q6YS05_ORYSJ|nr:peptide transporter-like protein [Oryza sativa Japonica Group]